MLVLVLVGRIWLDRVQGFISIQIPRGIKALWMWRSRDKLPWLFRSLNTDGCDSESVRMAEFATVSRIRRKYTPVKSASKATFENFTQSTRSRALTENCILFSNGENCRWTVAEFRHFHSLFDTNFVNNFGRETLLSFQFVLTFRNVHCASE